MSQKTKATTQNTLPMVATDTLRLEWTLKGQRTGSRYYTTRLGEHEALVIKIAGGVRIRERWSATIDGSINPIGTFASAHDAQVAAERALADKLRRLLAQLEG